MRAAVARPSHVILWIVALGLLAWFSSTGAGGRFDHAVAELVARFRGPAVTDVMSLADEALRPMWMTPATLVVAALLFPRLRGMALLVPGSFGAAVGLSFLLKWVFGRERPMGDLVLPGLDTTGAAFPSAHMAGVTAAGIALVQLGLPRLRRGLRRLLAVFVVALIGLTAFSRVYVGAHWATDVAAGLATGILGVVIALLVLRSRAVGLRR